MRVLVVDDSFYARQIVVRALQRVLEERGEVELAVEEASDGEAALELVLGGSFDLVISDLYMREMDGIELARAMRSESKTPVGLLTSDASQRVHQEAREAGARFVLTKPLERDALRRVLERLFPV